MMREPQSQRGDGPSRAWYLVAVAAIVCGIAGAVEYVLPRIEAIGDGLQQVIVPGDKEITLKAAGDYTVFHEHQSVVDGKVYATREISGLQLSLTTNAGQAIALRATSTSMEYSFGSRSGSALYSFSAPEAGVYRLNGTFDDGRTEPKVVLAIGQGFFGSLMMTILATIAIALAGILGGVLIAVWVALKRGQAQTAGQRA